MRRDPQIDKPQAPPPRTVVSSVTSDAPATRAPHNAAGRHRGLWIIWALLMMTIFGLAGIAILELHRQALTGARREMTNLGVVLAEQTSRTVQSVDLVLQEVESYAAKFDLASPEAFRAQMAGDDMRHFLAGHMQNLPQADAIALIDANSALLNWSKDGPVPPVSFSDRPYFSSAPRHTDQQAEIIGPVKGRISDKWLLLIVRRIYSADGVFLGTVAGLVETRFLEDFYQTIHMLPGESVTLLRRDGTVIAGQPDIEDRRARQMVRQSPWFDRVANGGGSYRSPGYLGLVPQIITVHPLRDYPLVVDVNVSEDAAVGDWRRDTIVITGTAISVAAGFSVLLGTLGIQFRRRENYASELLRRSDMLQASERRFRDFAETSSDWFWEQDRDLRFMEIDAEGPLSAPIARSHLGKLRWELSDTTEEPEKWSAHERALRNHEQFRDFRYSRPGSDGKSCHVSINGVPVYDSSGQFAGYRGTGRDITEQIEADQELRRAKDRAEQAEVLLRDAVDSVSEGFVIYDADDRLILCNEAYRVTYPGTAHLITRGVKYETLIRHNLAAGIYPAAAGREEAWLAKFLEDHRAGNRDVETQLSDGTWAMLVDRRMRNGGIAGLRFNITALKHAQAALGESEARLDRAQAIAGIGSWELDLVTKCYAWSKELYRIRGVSPETFEPKMESLTTYVHPDDIPGVRQWLNDLAAGADQGVRETRIVRPDGEIRLLRIEGQAMRNSDGVIRRIAGTMQDITERRLIEQQLIQSQKMEAIGNLTGGMAHDFNNVLGVIIGNLDLLGRLISADPAATELCDDARDGALRCADLIRRLLAFARRQPLRPERIDVNGLVEGIGKLLSRTLGENIELSMRLDPELWPTTADPVQLEAALTNLATNARDAMKRGGRLAITTSNACLDADYAAQNPEVAPGEYVLVEATDTGSGIDPALINRIFDPFFTTKEPGKGTGLGLSMVFGFVKQSGGHIAVYSEPGHGSAFRIYLPRDVADATTPVATDQPPAVVGGDETILVVEDNSGLRRAAVHQLTALGYATIEADNAEKALRVLAEADHVDLLFTDVIMPGEMDGFDLALEAARRLPTLRVLLTSGFPDLRRVEHRMANPDYRLLSKPYRHDDLARAVRQVLDDHSAPANKPKMETVS